MCDSRERDYTWFLLIGSDCVIQQISIIYHKINVNSLVEDHL